MRGIRVAGLAKLTGLSALVVLAACGDSEIHLGGGSPDGDGGGANDASLDASNESVSEASSDARGDGTSDGSGEASSDAPSDGGPTDGDARVPDAPPDAVDADGGCATIRIATGAKSPTYVAVDADGVFWSETGHAGTGADPQVIMQAALDGSSSQIVTPLSGTPGGIALDAGYVYYVQSGTPPPSGYSVFRAGKPGKPPSTRPAYAVFASPAQGPGAIAVDANQVVWVDATRVYTMGINAAQDSWTAAASSLSGAAALALDGTTAWVGEQTGALLAVDLSTVGSPAPVAGSTPSFGVAVDAVRVVWTDEASVFAQPKTGGATTTVATCATACDAVATDGTNIVWSTLTDIWEAPVSGGTPRQLATGSTGVHHLAIDATHVYWTDTTGGEVWSACK